MGIREDRKNDKKGKGKSEYLAPKAGIVKQKFQGTCYNCDQPGHRAANCKMPKRVNPRQANMVDENVDMIAMVSDVCAMISEVNLVGTNNSGWWIDTGATRHVCADKSMFHSFRAVDNGQKLYMGNSATADIKGEGDVILKMTSEKELKLTNVLYVPEIRKNLVSGWLLNKFGFRLVFESDKFVLSKNQMYVGKGYAVNAMFKLNVMVVKNDINKMNSFAYLIESSNVWHGRLGHVNFNSMRRLIKFNSIPNFHIDSKYKCETCVEAKLTRTSFKSVKRTTEPLDMIHTDICDLKSLPTKGGNKYFITFIDDCTKYCYVYLLKSKDEAIDKFVLYKTEVENQLGKKIKVVRSDRGGEYVAPFAELCAKHGIRHEFTAPYSPQQNGIAERKNRTLKEMVTAMLISSGMSQDMWGEAILTATYLLNKIPRKEKEETPYELWMGRKPSYQYLRVWGCLAKLSPSMESEEFIALDNCGEDGGMATSIRRGHPRWPNLDIVVYSDLGGLSDSQGRQVCHVQLYNSFERCTLENRRMTITPKLLPTVVKHNRCAVLPTTVANHVTEKPEYSMAVESCEAWKHSDFLCHNYVLNGLIDPLYNVYCKTTTAKELWESLERKYKTEDAGTKKFVVARFLDYKMVDQKSVGQVSFRFKICKFCCSIFTVSIHLLGIRFTLLSLVLEPIVNYE
ncbi:retrovirus-related pol polyprotein from transposon TNT 1-94 [Tanacetum coccineum]